MKLASDTDIRDDLGGVMSVKFKKSRSLDEYCRTHIGMYNRDRFEVVALRFYFKRYPVITIYAIDKNRQESTKLSTGKIPVKKFKFQPVSLYDMLPFIEEANFTLTTGIYPMKDMQVINR